jgi:hypothetical protein
VIGLLSLFMAIVIVFEFLVAFGTHGLIGLRKREERADEELNKPRRGYVEGKSPHVKKSSLGPRAKEGKAHPQTTR